MKSTHPRAQTPHTHRFGVARFSAAFVFSIMSAGSDQAAAISFLSIDGSLGSGNVVAAQPLDADYSWFTLSYPDNSQYNIWGLAPGYAGGVIIDAAQPSRGEITAPRPMFNQTSWLFSVGTGVHFDEVAQTFDVSNLRLSWVEDYDFGFGSGYSALVPQVAGFADTAGANGWWFDAMGDYHLLFRGTGKCAGCELTVHLTGQIVAAPLPAAGWLFGAGFAALLSVVRGRHRIPRVR